MKVEVSSVCTEATVRGLAHSLLAKMRIVGHASAESWGCHEHEKCFYSGRKSVLAEELVPRLVSRVVYTGPGDEIGGTPG